MDPTLLLRDVQNGQFYGLVASMRALAFDYSNCMMSETYFEECSPPVLSTEDSAAREGGRELKKRAIQHVLLGGVNRSNAWL